MRAIVAILLGVFGTSCGAASTGRPDRAMTITEVIFNIDSLNGRRVRVAGYLGECAGYDCRLFRNKAEQEQWDRFIAAIMQGGRGNLAEPPALGLGSGEADEFDRRAARYTNSYVIITGIATNRCRYHGQPACTDRSTDLEPIAIGPWHRAAGSQ